MSSIFDKQEIDQLLSANSDSPIWFQKKQKSKIPLKLVLIIHLLVWIGAIIYFFITNWNSSDFIYQFIWNILISSTLIYTFYIGFDLNSTLHYTIYPSKISFEWGILKIKKSEIPMSDVTAIELVNYSDQDTSTIHFGTSKEYKIKKMNLFNYEPRPHITFENVKNGKEVYDLLKYLQNVARK